MTKILVIDDDPMVRRALTRALEAAGHDVSSASDGRRGLEEFRRCPPDLVITDIIMPEQEGIETILKLKKLAPALPIIAISGGARLAPTHCLCLGLKLGAVEAIEKPFTTTQLYSAVDKALAGTTNAELSYPTHDVVPSSCAQMHAAA